MTRSERERRARTGSGGGRTPRRRRRRWARIVHGAKARWHGLLALDPVWIVMFIVVGTWALMPRSGGQWQPQSVEAGSIAPRDYVAPEDALLPDEGTTDALRQRARDEVLPVFDFDPAAGSRLAVSVASLFATGREILAPEGPEMAAPVLGDERDERDEGRPEEQVDLPRELTPYERLSASTTWNLSPDQSHLFVGLEFTTELEENITSLLVRLMEIGVVTAKSAVLEHRSRGILLRDLDTGREGKQLDLYDYLVFPDEVRGAIEADLRSWAGLSRSQRSTIEEFLLSNIGPNLYPNQGETERRQAAAAASVEQVYNRVIEGQIIVRKGDKVDARAAELIDLLSAKTGVRAWLLPMLGVMLFLSSLVLMLWLGVRRERAVRTRRQTVLGELLVLMTIAVVGTRLFHLLATGLAGVVDAAPFDQAQSYFYAIPFAALALLTALLYGRTVALIVALAFSMLAGLLVEETGWTWVVYCMAGSLAAIMTIDHYQFKQRSVLTRAGGVVSAVSAATVLMLRAVEGGLEVSAARLGLELACALVGGMLAAAVASFAIPLLESAFSLTTTIKLVELANTNLPLLRRLAFEAPGTFQHSLMVANLSKAGCDAIGADSVLAYTGALYHDIGKMLRPEYFVENQRTGVNRHDKLQPSMSALVIINHVKEGAEMARDYHLPQPILDAITQHHGTRVISFFYNRAKECQDPDAGEVSVEKYRYPGPKPDGKAMGVLMLADGIEAASRTLQEPSPARIRNLVKRIIDDSLDDRQLDETDLTLSDLRQVSEAFQSVLAHIHHRRLDYPGFDFNTRQEGPPADSGERPPSLLEAKGADVESTKAQAS